MTEYSCKLLYPSADASPQNVGNTIAITGTVIETSSMQGCKAQVRLDLSSADCIFTSNQKSSILVETGDDGTIPVEFFTSNVATGGTVTGTPVSPAGNPDSKPFVFTNATGSLALDLDLDYTTQIGDGVKQIAATATVTRGSDPQNDVDVTLSITDVSGPQFTGTLTSTISGKTDGSGTFKGFITDKMGNGKPNDRGYAQAAINNQPSAPAPQSKSFTFVAPGNAYVTVSPSNSTTFVALTGSLLLTATVSDEKNAPIPQATVTFQIQDGGHAYFTSGKEKTRADQNILTQQDGTASITIACDTWLTGGVVAVAADCSTAGPQYQDTAPEIPDPIPFTVTQPAGLYIQLNLDYSQPNATLFNDESTWSDYSKVGSAPTAAASWVRVRAAYMLDAQPWQGYGDITFSLPVAQVDAPSAPWTFGTLDPDRNTVNANTTAGDVTATYNARPDGSITSSTPPTNAITYVQRSSIGYVTLTATQPLPPPLRKWCASRRH